MYLNFSFLKLLYMCNCTLNKKKMSYFSDLNFCQCDTISVMTSNTFVTIFIHLLCLYLSKLKYNKKTLTNYVPFRKIFFKNNFKYYYSFICTPNIIYELQGHNIVYNIFLNKRTCFLFIGCFSFNEKTC